MFFILLIIKINERIGLQRKLSNHKLESFFLLQSIISSKLVDY